MMDIRYLVVLFFTDTNKVKLPLSSDSLGKIIGALGIHKGNHRKENLSTAIIMLFYVQFPHQIIVNKGF